MNLWRQWVLMSSLLQFTWSINCLLFIVFVAWLWLLMYWHFDYKCSLIRVLWFWPIFLSLSFFCYFYCCCSIFSCFILFRCQLNWEKIVKKTNVNEIEKKLNRRFNAAIIIIINIIETDLWLLASYLPFNRR